MPETNKKETFEEKKNHEEMGRLSKADTRE